MRRRLPGATALLLAAATLLFWSGVSFALAPTLGADCGAGASILGSDSAGKVTLGTGVTARTCTLTFASPGLNAPSCAAMNETNSGGVNDHPAPLGVKSTTTTLVLDATTAANVGLQDRDVISYICVSY